MRDPPHICKTDEDGNPVCDPEANMAKAAEMEEHIHEDGHICPLCGSLPDYQQLYWELERYKLLLEQATAANKPAETAPAVAAKSNVPTMKEITICRTDTGRCQRKSIRADIDLESELPDHCEIK